MGKKTAVLIIMDGYGLGEENEGNAIYSAVTPVLDGLFASCPNTELSASGGDVGLPDGQIGNSEVGHTNIGAGRVVYQDLPRITKSISNGEFFENAVLIKAMDSCCESGALHLMGLLSDGGVHSHNTHLWALLDMAGRKGLSKVYIHAFLDGRDVSPRSGAAFVDECARKCREIGTGEIATVMGRFYAMDRDKRWERVERAYSAIVYGEAEFTPDPVAAVEKSYAEGITDEFVEPLICCPEGTVRRGDSVIFFNFRPDRARELTYALMSPDFDGFERKTDLSPLHYACMTQYDEKLTLPMAYPPEEIHGTLGEYLSSLGMTQLRIAETEKYAHVTFFLNGGREEPYPGEDRVLVPSPREFPTYDLIPEMSAYKVTDEVTDRIRSGRYDLVVLNYANCDMVGHTGVLGAAIKAAETVDECVGRVLKAVSENGGVALVTADHGNADRMFDIDGSPHTAHTTSFVPLILYGKRACLKPGKLADLSPTILSLMGLGIPEEMTGENLESDI